MVSPEEKLKQIEANKAVENAVSDADDATKEVEPETTPEEAVETEKSPEDPDKCAKCGNETFKVYDTYRSCLKCGHNEELLN